MSNTIINENSVNGVKINNPPSCEDRSVIKLLNAKGYNATEIHRQLCETLNTAMSEEKVWRRCVS